MIKFSTPQEIIAADAQSDQAQAENFFEGVKHRVTDSKGQQFSLGDFELPPRPGATKILLAQLEVAGWTSQRYCGRTGESGGYMIKPNAV